MVIREQDSVIGGTRLGFFLKQERSSCENETVKQTQNGPTFCRP